MVMPLSAQLLAGRGWPYAAFVTHETPGRSSRVIARIVFVLMAG